MADKLSFQEVQTICQVLGEFADARSEAQPDKDMILTVTKINGQETLQTARLSEMPWYARVVRWLGFGGATLHSVARFLQSHEPHLPRSFSRLQQREHLSLSYSDDDIDDISNMDKGTYTELKKQKVRGCEIFQRCVSNHNKLHYCKTYVVFQEYERTDLNVSGSSVGQGIKHTYPNPMGQFPAGDANDIRERYRSPIIDENQFLHLDPFFRFKTKGVSPNVLGFCYEYGLGTKANRDEALKNYREAADNDEYSACYNLGRLLFEDGDAKGAIDALRKGEDILIDKINQALDFVDHLQAVKKPANANPDDLIRWEVQKKEICQERIESNAVCIKTWEKALNQIYHVLIEAFRTNGNIDEANEYEQKVEQIINNVEDDV